MIHCVGSRKWNVDETCDLSTDFERVSVITAFPLRILLGFLLCFIFNHFGKIMGPLSLTCAICGQQSKKYSHLKSHIKTHTNEVSRKLSAEFYKLYYRLYIDVYYLLKCISILKYVH